MIAPAQPQAQPQTETFQVGDYIAPTWSAGADRRGAVVKVFSKGKRAVEWWAEVRWLVGRDTGTTGTIAWRQLRLVWRPVLGEMVKLKSGGYRTNTITKIHDTGELQLQPQSGTSFRVALEAIVISEAPEPAVEPVSGEIPQLRQSCDRCQHGQLEKFAEGAGVSCSQNRFAGSVLAGEVIARVTAEACDGFEESAETSPEAPSKLPTRITEVNSVAIYQGEAYYSEPKQGAWRLATDEEIASLEKGDRVSQMELPWVYKFVKLGGDGTGDMVAVCAFVDHPCFRYHIPVGQLQVTGGGRQKSEPPDELETDLSVKQTEAATDDISYAVGDRVSRSQHHGTITAIEAGTIAVVFDNNHNNAVHISLKIAPKWLVKLSDEPASTPPHPTPELENQLPTTNNQQPSFAVGDRCYYVVETNTAQIIELRDGEVRLKLDHGKNPEGTSWLRLTDCHPLTDAHVKDIHLLEPGTPVKGETLTGKAYEGRFRCLTTSGMVMIDLADDKRMMLVPGTVVLTQNSELRTQNSEVGSQESESSPYEYTPIDPTPVWFSLNGDPANLVEGQAIAKNGKGNVRIAWGEERESDIASEKVYWSKPEPQLAAGFQSVPIALITVDPALQPRVVMDESAIAEYQEAMAAGTWDWQKDPMIAYWDGASLLLSSGGHRYQGAVRAGLQYVSLEVRLGDRSEALLNAPCANMQHGVRMTSADKNRAIALILRDPKWQQESSRSLSRLLSERGFRVDHKKIEQIRQGLATSGEIPQIEQRVVRRGDQTYTTAAPAVRQDQHSLEEVKALYAELGEFSINGDPAKPYKFECIGVLQRFKSLDEAYERFGWMRDRVIEKQKEYATTCVDCAKRVDLKEGAEFECSAFGRTHAVSDDPGAAGCRYYAKKRWCDYSHPDNLPQQPEAFHPAIERPEPPAGAIVTGYSAKDGEEDLQLTGAVVATDGDRLRLENGGMVYRDSAVIEPDPEQEQAAARDGLKQAIARWTAVNEGEWTDTALESVLHQVLNVLSNFEF